MKRKNNNKNLIILLLIILLLILSVGYSVFSDILTIQGTASAKGTFNLEFQNAEVVKNVGADIEKTTAIISPDKNTLTVNVADLSYPGAGVEFSVDIVNAGAMPGEIQAVLPTNITGSDKIKISGLEEIKVGHPELEPGDSCNIHFTVEWPVDSGEILESESNISFGLQIEYTQSTSQNTNTVPGEDIEKPTVREGKLTEIVTSEDYGRSINYVATIKGQQINNWKVLYNDKNNVYIILDDYLPNNLVPNVTGLDKIGTYVVNSNKDRDTLINGLKNKSYWNLFANGIEGATATGSPEYEILIKSYNEKYGTNLNENSNECITQNIDNTDKLYIPHSEIYNEVNGYWLTNECSSYSNGVLGVVADSRIACFKHNNIAGGIRPVVCLPSSVIGTIEENVQIKDAPKPVNQTLSSQITAEDYGKNINYEVTVKGQIVNNWKVLYNDANNIYIILDDFLPNRLMPGAAGLDTLGTYVVNSSKDRDTLINGLKNKSYWTAFANGIEGATAVGSPEYETLIKSYNEKYGTSLSENPNEYTTSSIDITDKLYVPHTELYNGVNGYWLTNECSSYSNRVLGMNMKGIIANPVHTVTTGGIRPVICLPSTVIGTVGETVEIKDVIKPENETLVNQITAQDYGKSINYNVTVNNSQISNWKVLYNDVSNIYIILDSFLPNTLVPASSGLNTTGTYIVNSTQNRNTLINGLNSENNWSALAKGIEGATATGAPTFNMIMKSYNEKHNTDLNEDSKIYEILNIDNTDKLYIPYAETYNGTNGYWLANECPKNSTYVWGVVYNGKVNTYSYKIELAGIRPVVKLPATVKGTVGTTINIK